MKHSKQSGMTLIEILIGTILLSVVFLAGISIYVSCLKIFAQAQSAATSTSTETQLIPIVKNIRQANYAFVSNGNTQLDIRVDLDMCGDTRATPTPSNAADDSWWHYRFVGGALRYVCDNNQNTSVSGSDAVLMQNMQTSGALQATFTIVESDGTNGSYGGTFTSPSGTTMTLDHRPNGDDVRRTVLVDAIPSIAGMNRVQTRISTGAAAVGNLL